MLEELDIQQINLTSPKIREGYLNTTCDLKTRIRKGELTSKEYYTLIQSENDKFHYDKALFYKHGKIPIDKLVNKTDNNDMVSLPSFIPVE